MLPTEVKVTTTLTEGSLSSPCTLTMMFEEEEDVLVYFKEVSVAEENMVNMSSQSQPVLGFPIYKPQYMV